MIGTKLKTWREQNRLNLETVGTMLGGVTGPTISRWESGQEIPGPPSILLDWLIEGKVPFQDLSVPEALQKAMWKVKMSLEAWEKLEEIRIAEGYASMTDFIASLIQDELHAEKDKATASDRPDLGLAAEDPVPYRAGDAPPALPATGVDSRLIDVARDYMAKNPLPDELDEAGKAAPVPVKYPTPRKGKK